DGLPGADGTNGIDGKDGAPGAQGPQGDPGKDGKDGTNGIDGAPGPQGPKGDKGDKGDTGAQGPAGTLGAKYVTQANATASGNPAVVSCAATYTAISGGYYVTDGNDSYKASSPLTSVQSFPGKVTGQSPDPTTRTGWVVTYSNGAAGTHLQVWAICVPAGNVS
ncbi:MAG: hypothetical protein ACXVWW_09610, partial [Nocardioides sp.]